MVVLLMSCTLVNGLTNVPPTISVTNVSFTPTTGSTATSRVPTPVSTATLMAPTATSTASVPSDAVVVNTLEQGVYPFNPNGKCALGEAIQSVLLQQAVDGCVLPPGSKTVYMPTGTYSLTEPDNAPVILFGKPQSDREHLDPAGFPVIAGTVTILGNDSVIQRSGSNQFGIFQVFIGGNLTLKDLTISGGDVSATHHPGGAIENLGGSLALVHVTLSHNMAYNGGALDIAGGINAENTVTGSTITQNTALVDGGGIHNAGHLLVKQSVISSNIAKDGVFGGGGIDNDGQDAQLTLDDSQVFGNSATLGGGIFNDGGTVNITDQSLLSGNLATWKFNGLSPDGGGGINSRADNDQLVIDQSLVIGNQAPASFGGGIIAGGQKTTITGSVFSGNIAGTGSALEITGGEVSVTGSCILDNQSLLPKSYNGIENDNSLAVDASQNWWGTKGPSVSADVKTASQMANPPVFCASSLPTPYPTLNP